ncbi:hypothetical protein AB0I52_18380 [Streptomyces sp. NPDC050423]|uniref:hypothetical protein n=1 Tax=Streptomyces sp. NPDC050423 TaxID=3155402 RepID=UPI003429D047
MSHNWMIRGAQADSLSHAMSGLRTPDSGLRTPDNCREPPGGHAGTVMTVRVTTVSDTCTKTHFTAGPTVETTVLHQAYGTAVQYG